MNKVKILIDGKVIEVDEHCADMVLFFNEIGLKTRMCCQGHEKPIFRIWFSTEDCVDQIIEEFIYKTAQWTEVFIRPTNEERTQLETYRGIRGLRGWIYKRSWYPKGKYKREEWIYQSEGENNEEAIMNAKYDLLCMRAIYFGTNLDNIQKRQQRLAEDRLNNIKK
ncbi:MAG TPA: hypothetical protein GXZ90_07400 [Clostridiales bacterium]|nr:hypothetical protein [Clostridiales bacterium]